MPQQFPLGRGAFRAPRRIRRASSGTSRCLRSADARTVERIGTETLAVDLGGGGQAPDAVTGVGTFLLGHSPCAGDGSRNCGNVVAVIARVEHPVRLVVELADLLGGETEEVSQHADRQVRAAVRRRAPHLHTAPGVRCAALAAHQCESEMACSESSRGLVMIDQVGIGVRSSPTVFRQLRVDLRTQATSPAPATCSQRDGHPPLGRRSEWPLRRGMHTPSSK